MAQSKYIEAVKKAAAGKPKSTDWFRRKIKEFGTPTQTQLMRDGKITARPNFGRLNMFVYDPKLKKELPYYDTFPLVLPIDTFKGGFLGINLHYLPINLRIRLLDRLVDETNNNKFDATTRFNLTYKLLKGVSGKPYYKACYKHYLSSHVRSSFALVDSPDWEIAIFLPIESFKKSSMSSVWSDSRRKIS